MQNATLHVKINPEFASSLRKMASVRGASVGELVRQALISTYQADMLGVSRPQRQALEAYMGGFISIGKLAESMGTDVIQTRNWLREHGFVQNSSFSAEDSENA